MSTRKKYPSSRLNIVKAAIPLERYTAPLRTAKVENPNNVKTDARIQLDDAEVEESITDRVQPNVEKIRVEKPINPHATVDVEQTGAGKYPTVWADLDDELRRQQLLEANNKVRQVEDAARMGDMDNLRITLGRLLPGEADLPPHVLAALGNQYSPESKVLIALLTKLTKTNTKAAEAQSFRPTPKEVSVDTQTGGLEDKAEKRQEDPKAQATDDLRQARDAEEARQAREAAAPTMSPTPPRYESPVSDLADELAGMSLNDDEEAPRPTTGSGIFRRSGAAPKPVRGKGVVAEPAALSAQTKRWEEMRTKQPTLFRLTMKSQAKAAPLIKYMHEMGVPVSTLGRGAGRFPTEHLKQAVLDWHEAQLLQGEGVSVDDDILPQPYVKKVQAKTPAEPRGKKTAKSTKATAPDSDDDEEPDAERWDIVTGEIGAGNNNPALIAEARSIAQRALKKRALTAAQFAKLDAHLRAKAG